MTDQQVNEPKMTASQGLPANIHGLPVFNMDDMGGATIPTDYDIVSVLSDIIMCEIADESETGEVKRDGIWISKDMVKKMWRVAKAIKVGPLCTGVKVGDYVMYPSDKGLSMISTGGKKYIFLNQGCMV